MLKVSLPNKPNFTEIGKNIGKVEIDGCYPGYGTTLGNAIRRVLLSSLTGAAVTSVKIKGASHEFSTVPGVLEDVIQIILNLKKIRFKVHKDEPVRLTLKEKGLKKVNASQIQCPSDVEVVNKDSHIVTLTDKKSEIEIEIEVQKGLGYVPVEQQEREKKEIGLIGIDAVFTPVRRVNYNVENTRVGKRTDFDKITFEIETDGTKSPQESFQEAAGIIIEQFKTLEIFSEIQEKEEAEGEVLEEVEAPKKKEDMKSAEDSALGTSVETLSFSTRTMNVLEKSGLKTVRDLIALSEQDIIGLEGMGQKGIKEIKKAVGNFGLTLKS